MIASTQPQLFQEMEKPILSSDGHNKEWGTFKDSLRAPIHSWFTYPAGFSYKAVGYSLQEHAVGAGQCVYDPFMGTGTTNLAAKKLGLHSFGVEAHPFVFWVAKTKLNWKVNKNLIITSCRHVIEAAQRKSHQSCSSAEVVVEHEFPELVLKCFEAQTLRDLLFIREAIDALTISEDVRDFLALGLTCVLRQVSSVATGWPYIAPNKQKTTSRNKNALTEFSRRIWQMLNDLQETTSAAHASWTETRHTVFEADCRDTQGLVPDKSIDHIFTSPPYLNNYDYADRTRMELYFFGKARTWGDITRLVRDKLITSATTQINRGEERYQISAEIAQCAPNIFNFLQSAVAQLGERRLRKGGKKSYDLMVSGYFNDLFQVLTDCFRVLKQGKKAVFVLGDSAPYGVYIPTDELIGALGRSVGFSDFKMDILRTRGGKWKDNPQRHDVLLRESIITLTK
jgi:DNA modification methylase